MPDTLSALIIATGAAVAGAAVQYGFRRYTETSQVRREIVETHLLQLQNSVESLYYRVNNLRHRVVSYTEFSARWPEERFEIAVASVSRFVTSVTDARLDTISAEAEKLISLLAELTEVPSALALASADKK